MLLALFLALVVALAAAEAPPVVAEIRADVQTNYQPGDRGEITVHLVYDDPSLPLEAGVVFLNVVERDPERTWPQAAHKVFASAHETPRVFRLVQDAAALKAGVGATLSFRLRDNARPGPYSLVVQLYRGVTTDPNRVRAEDRLLMKGFDFEIVAVAP